MKILIVGHGRSGKDELAKLLGLSFRSSSEVCLEEAIWPNWGKSRYNSIKECFEDRANHRQVWFEMIREFNSEDEARLAKIIVKDSECYVGLRSDVEFNECKAQKVFDLVIWVDAKGRVPVEPSCKITEGMCDVTVMNRGTYEEFITVAVPKIANYIEGSRFAIEMIKRYNELDEKDFGQDYYDGLDFIDNKFDRGEL